STIEPLFEEMQAKSIAIIAHRFSDAFRKWEWNGIYNVGWVTFRRDDNALSCLRWWREQCIEWCYDRIEDNRFADQKYLDDWPTLLGSVRKSADGLLRGCARLLKRQYLVVVNGRII